MKVFTLKKRKDFVRAASAFKAVVNGVVLQAALSLPKPQEECCFVGYTATKRLGKAHVRNRCKRRLRAAAAAVLPQNALAGVNYVLIARHNTSDLNFAYLTRKLKDGIVEINRQIVAAREQKC